MSGILITLLLASAQPKYNPRHLIIKLNPQTNKTVASTLKWDRIGDAYTLIGNKTGIEEIDRLAESYGLKEVRRLIVGKLDPKAVEFGLDRYYLLVFDHDIDALALREKFSKLSSVESADIDELKPLFIEPNDPLFGPDYWTQQWYLFDINAPQGWDITTGDPNIVLGPIDSGVDWDHPDIYPALWVNPGEDVNNNGVFDYPDDLNGIDDDNNGYIDDVIGFNFISYTWDPTPTEPGNDHGTHVFGIVTAATNNAIGIAGVGWDTKGIAFKCGDANYIYISAAVNAIYYSATHGAVATNHSYGGSYNGSENSAMQYAHNLGVSIFAAAGNDNTSLIQYPAGYTNVIAVAATGQGGHRADFTNYGTWVDISAPGVNILSTIPGGSYVSFDGTSMASPVVCGVAGLIRSLHPNWNAFQVDSAIMWGAVDIDSLNPGYEGMLGWGLVNVFNSLALSIYTGIAIKEIRFDGDGRPEPGENVKMYVKVYNRQHWQDATNVGLTLSTDDPNITITDNSINVGNLANGDTTSPSDYFEFQVSGTPRFTDLVVTISSNPQPAYPSDTFRVLIGYPPLLLVDDSGDPSLRGYYTDVFENIGLVYEVWNTTDGTPDLLAHPRSVVFWYTGDASGNVLSSAERTAIIDYLNSGGNFIISSQNLGNDAQSQSFINDYLKATVVSTDHYYRGMRGYDGDPIGDSVFLKLYGSGSAGNSQECDIITSISPADSSLYFTSPTGGGNFGPGLVKYNSGSYKTIYMSFPFEAITSEDPNRTTREELFSRFLSWLEVSVEENQYKQVLRTDFEVLTPVVLNVLRLRVTGQTILSIYNVTGQKVFTINHPSLSGGQEVISIPLSRLGTGTYFIVGNTNKVLKKVKFIKIR